MIHWAWLVFAFLIGEVAGMGVIALVSAGRKN